MYNDKIPTQEEWDREVEEVKKEIERDSILQAEGRRFCFDKDMDILAKSEKPTFHIGDINFLITYDETIPENEVHLKTYDIKTLIPMLYILTVEKNENK